MPTNVEALGYVANFNKRFRAPVPEFLKQNFKPVYIYNIHQMEHAVPLGSLGTFVIPACEEGKAYSEALVVPGFIADEYDRADGQGNMAWNPEQGANVARDIVGLGSSLPKPGGNTTNREYWGVFIAKAEIPSAKELAQAKEKLTEQMTILLREADTLALEGQKGIAQINGMHRKASKFLNQKRDWASLPEKMDNCPGCGDPIKPGIVRHSCGAILNMERARELGMLTPEQIAAMESAQSKSKAKSA